MTDTANPPATVQAAPPAVQESLKSPDEWWDAPEADEVEGYDLLKEEALLQVVGVPFMGTRVIFRDGIQRKGVKWRDDFVSLEIRVAPASVLKNAAVRILSRRSSAGVSLDSITASPDEQLVLNDGSTGLYRQVVQYLAAKGLITLPEGEEKGEKGESIYDLPRSEWVTGAEEATEGIEITLRCSRGLRFSDYSNDYTGDEKARTWYIA